MVNLISLHIYVKSQFLGAKRLFMERAHLLLQQVGGVYLREAFVLVTYFNELNKTVNSMLSAKNVCVLTESRLRADGFCTPRFLI